MRWLSKEKMLKRFYDLIDEISTFMDMKGKIILELSDDNWVRDLAFLVDLTMHFNDLNTKLQGQGGPVCSSSVQSCENISKQTSTVEKTA